MTTSINQILNSALMEAVELKENTGVPVLDNDKKNAKDYVDQVKKEEDDELKREEQRAKGTGTLPPAESPSRMNLNAKHAGIGAIALGAGLGAVALAKKLRSKKAAVTSAKAKDNK
jgi:hypothetical protein